MNDVILLSSDDGDSNDKDVSFKTVEKSPKLSFGRGACNFEASSSRISSMEISPLKSGSSSANVTSKISPWKAARSVHTLSESDSSDSDGRSKEKLKKGKDFGGDADDDLPEVTFSSSEVQTTSSKESLKSPINRVTPTSSDVETLSPPLVCDPLTVRTESDSDDVLHSKPKGKGRGRKVDLATREEQQRIRKAAQNEKERLRLKAKEERERKKQEAALNKELKQAIAEVSRSTKQGECLKLVRVILDPALLTSDFGGELLTALKAANVQYRIEELAIPCSINWERDVLDVHLDENKVCREVSVQKDEQVLVVWLWDHFVQLVHDRTLCKEVKEMRALLPDGVLTIAVYGIEDYFRVQKVQKRRGVRANVLGTAGQKAKGKEAVYEAAPQVSRGDVEFALAELQILVKVNCRCINTESDLGNLVCQFSKAIAEAPNKKERSRRGADQLEWYALGDSKDCVPVDKDGNGLARLWQQQLCQFALASIDTAEAIANVYPTPMLLIEAYDQCSSEKEAEQLLQDIPVRRGPGPLATSRRVGPQLSKKIYTFFTTTDGDHPIAQE